MKLFCFFFFVFAAQSVLGDDDDSFPIEIPTKKLAAGLASIRDSNSGFPKCTGVFVSRNTLVTTARCLFCDRDCKLKVYVAHIDGSSEMEYDIESITIHDEYEVDPHKNDIGLLKIKGAVSNDLIVELHDFKASPLSFETYVYFGKFLHGKYIFERNLTTLITNAKCTFALHSYIREDDFCAYSPNRFYFNEPDQGTPLLYNKNGKMYLLGTYVENNLLIETGSKIAVYQGIGPYQDWIAKTAKNKTVTPCNSQPTLPPLTTPYPLIVAAVDAHKKTYQ